MSNVWFSVNRNLLSAGAILRCFDRPMLQQVAQATPDEIARLLSSEYVEMIPTEDGLYRLRSDMAADMLAALQAEQTSERLQLHTAAFTYFLDQLRQDRRSYHHLDIMDECIHHLDQLYPLLSLRMEWQTIKAYVEALQSLAPSQQRHLNRLHFYEGYIALRTQNGDYGAELLMELNARADLEDDLRVYTLNALAQVFWYRSDYDQALSGYRTLYRAAGETANVLYQGIALFNMSAVHDELEQYEQAFELGMQSLRIFRELQQQAYQAYALYAVGRDAMYLGRWPIAQQHYQEAIQLFDTLGIAAGLASLHWGQAFLYHILGDETQSAASYQKALEAARSLDHTQRSTELDALLHLGFLYHTQARWEMALDYYEQALDLARQLHHSYRISQIHYQRAQLFERLARPAEAFAAYAQAIEGVEALRGAAESEEIKLGRLGSTQQIYEAMVLLCLAQGRASVAFDYVERARSRAFLDMLAKKSPALYDALAQPVATLAELQAQLPAGALLLEYFTIGVLPRGESLVNMLPPANTRLREHLTNRPQTIIFAVTRERLEVFQPALDPNTLRPQPGDPGPGRRLLYPERRLNQLYERLIAPAAQLLAGRELLFLIPHGPLHYVPFLALRAADGRHLLEAGGPAITRAPSATILLRNCLGRPDRPAAGMLALGYNDTERTELRYAEAEAQLVAELLGGQAWTGPAAKSRRLLDEGRAARWLHIAGHAIYDPHDPLGSYLRLGQGDSLAARAIMGELDLNAELVALSACMSGLSHVVPGDELLGLQRAFLYAGVPAVLCTLWEANDFVALLVMDRFYASLRAGQPAAAALRDAQVAVRDMTGRELQATLARWRVERPDFAAAIEPLPAIEPHDFDQRLYADPMFWAPFMLIGRPG